MAAIARFGFEGQKFPNNVSTSGVYRFTAGRSSGTAMAGSGSGLYLTTRPTGYGTTNYVDVNRGTSNGIVVNYIPSTEVYSTFQLKNKATGYLIGDTGGAYSVTSSFVVRHGNIQAQYNFVTSKFEFYNTSNSTTLYTSSVVSMPVDVWVPISFGVKYGSVGNVTFIFDGVSYIYNGIVAPTTGISTSSMFFTNGESGSFVTGIGIHPPYTFNDPFYNSLGGFEIDDIAMNNNISMANSTGSYGMSDTSFPPYISCQLVQFSATGSNTVGWNTPSGNIINTISSSNDYLTSSFMPRPVLELVPSSLLVGPTNIEGINYYFSGAYREGSSNAFIFPSTTISSGSVNAAASFPLATVQRTGSQSVFEKDLGGKITYNEFINGKIILGASQWINKNFFGRGTLGDVRYTSSVILGDSSFQGDYVVSEYNNLILDSGSLLATTGSKNGLIIYVRENCIINGTISMDGSRAPASSGSLFDGFHFFKNVATNSFSETGSISYLNSYLSIEQLYQAYQASLTSECGITGSVTLAGTNGVNRNPGGGGNGGFWSLPGGSGGTAGTFGGGSGGGGSAGGGGFFIAGGSAAPLSGPAGTGGSSGGYVGGNGGRGGGVIYLIVGKTLFIGSSGKITSAGQAGTNGSFGSAGYGAGGGGGGGGGSINIFYGLNFINSGSFSVAGGAGGSGNSNGSAGGSGSLTITKILTN